MTISCARRSSSGFSLIELVVALLILGIMMVTVMPALFRYVTQARESTANQDLMTIKQSILIYHAKIGQYPDSLHDLVRKPSNPQAAALWRHPFLEDFPKDPWQQDYVYRKNPPRSPHPFELYSLNDPGEPEAGKIDVWAIK